MCIHVRGLAALRAAAEPGGWEGGPRGAAGRTWDFLLSSLILNDKVVVAAMPGWMSHVIESTLSYLQSRKGDHLATTLAVWSIGPAKYLDLRGLHKIERREVRRTPLPISQCGQGDKCGCPLDSVELSQGLSMWAQLLTWFSPPRPPFSLPPSLPLSLSLTHTLSL